MLSILSLKNIFAAAIVIAVMADAKKLGSERLLNKTVLSYFTYSPFTKKNTVAIADKPIVTSNPASSVIPFSRAGNLILINAKAGTLEGNFILDTGAPGLILNMTYLRDYKTIETSGEEQGGGITGESIASAKTNLATFSIGAITYYKLNADRIQLGHIENSKGVKILGLLGMELFEQFEMIIDYENNLIYLHLISNKEARTYKSEQLKDTAAYSTLDIKVVDHKILTFGTMGTKKLTFLVDTGAETNVIDSRLSENVLDNVVITRRIKLNGAGAGKIDALYGDMSNLKLGNRNMSSMPVLVTNMEKMCYSYDRCLDGMLGFDFLSMQKIGFNFVTRKMYIWK